MAAKADTGIFFDGANSGCVAQDMFYGSTKFHSFMTKCTIVSYFSHIRLTTGTCSGTWTRLAVAVVLIRTMGLEPGNRNGHAAVTITDLRPVRTDCLFPPIMGKRRN